MLQKVSLRILLSGEFLTTARAYDILSDLVSALIKGHEYVQESGEAETYSLVMSVAAFAWIRHVSAILLTTRALCCSLHRGSNVEGA